MKILLSSLYPYAFFILLLIVPFDEHIRVLPNILLGILVVAFPFVITKEDLGKLNNPGVYLFLGLFIYLIVSSLLLYKWDENFYIIKKILISVVLIIFYLPVKDFKKINSAIIYSALLAIAYSSYNIIVLVKETGTFNFGDSQGPLDTLLIDRLYLGLLCILSILISYKEMTKKFSAENKYYLANILLNIVFLFVIVSKIAIISLVAIIILRFFYKGIKLKVVFVTLGVTALVTVAAFFANENLGKRFFYTTSTSAEIGFVNNFKLREPRTKIWECSYLIAKYEAPVIEGLGFKETNNKLIECYKDNIELEERKQWFLFKKFNTHNQFIDFYLSTGVISLILFLGIFIFIFIKKRRDYFSTAILISMVLFACVESFFHRQIGAYYFGIVLIYLLIENNKKVEELTEE